MICCLNTFYIMGKYKTLDSSFYKTGKYKTLDSSFIKRENIKLWIHICVRRLGEYTSNKHNIWVALDLHGMLK